MRILNPSALGGGGGSDIANSHVDSWVQTRTLGNFTCPTSGDGTEITPLTVTVTPQKAGNKMLVKFYFSGEFDALSNVFNVSRNGTLLTDSADASNNRWSGITADLQDGTSSNTPWGYCVTIMDESTLAAASTYRLLVRSANGTINKDFFLARTQSSTGADGRETTLSRTEITEYVV